jgi:hypothetical protein
VVVDKRNIQIKDIHQYLWQRKPLWYWPITWNRENWMFHSKFRDIHDKYDFQMDLNAEAC